MRSRLLVCASGSLLNGCDALDPPVCESIARMGVLVEVRHSMTTAAAGTGATGEFVDGPCREELAPTGLPVC